TQKEKQNPGEIEVRQKGRMADHKMQRWTTSQRKGRSQKKHRRRKRQLEPPREQHVHADEADQIVQQDVELHGYGERHGGSHQQEDWREQRNLGVLPQDVAAAVPGIPERQLVILEGALEDRRVLKEDGVPIGYAEAGAAGEQLIGEVKSGR